MSGKRSAIFVTASFALLAGTSWILPQSSAVAQQTATPAQPGTREAPTAEQKVQAAQDDLDAARAALAAAKAAKKESEVQKRAEEAEKRAAEAKKGFLTAHPDIVIAPSSSCLQPIVERTGAYYAPMWRPTAGTDYVVLGYDAQNHFVKWYDYKHQGGAPIFVNHNGSLVPVVYSREKVLVHVCGLHPTDTVSISTNDLNVPEQGADFRGVTASAATPLAPTLDALGSAAAAGTSLGPAGFTFGAPPGLPSSSTALFTVGSSKDGVTYTDATVAISPEALALEADVLSNNATDAKYTIEELEFGPSSDGTGPSVTAAPGSVAAVQAFADQLLSDLNAGDKFDSHGNLIANDVMLGDLSLSGFNDFLARTQTLVAQVNALANGVNLAAIPPRAISLRQNFEAIMGVRALVQHTIDDDAQYKTNSLYIDFPKDTASSTATCDAEHASLTSGGAIPGFNDASGKQILSYPPDSATCHAIELHAMEQFKKRYDDAFDYYTNKLQSVLRLTIMNSKLEEDKGDIEGLDGGILYSQIEDSSKKLLGPNIKLDDLDKNAETLSKSLADASNGMASKGPQQPGSGRQLADLSLNVDKIRQTLDTLHQFGEGCGDNINCVPKALTDLFKSLSGPDEPTDSAANQSLRRRLEHLDSTVGEIFAEINNRYKNSLVEQTDALPPLTSNTIVRIGINVQRNFTPFTLSGGATIGNAAPASTQGPASSPSGGQQSASQGKGNQAGNASTVPSSPSSSTSSSGNNDIAVLMEVHRLANFNLVGGAMAINVPSLSITPVPEYGSYGSPTITTTTSGTTTTTTYTYSAMGTCNGGTTPMLISTTSNTTGVTPAPALYYCYQTSQTSGWQPAGMAGVAWFPLHRDYFSRQRGAAPMWKNMVPSLLFASSITSLGSVFVGPNFEPINGIDFSAGYATAHQLSLPKGVSPHVVYPAGSTGNPPTLNLATHEKGGISFGVGFDLSVFLQLFSKTQGPSLP